MCMVCAYVSVILLALAAGYIVLLKADKAEGSLKKIGKIIGWIIIVVATLTLLWSIKMSMCCSKRGYCGHGKYGMYKSMHKGDHMKGMKDKECLYMKKHSKMMHGEEEK